MDSNTAVPQFWLFNKLLLFSTKRSIFSDICSKKDNKNVNLLSKTDIIKIENNSKKLIVFSTWLTSNIYEKSPWITSFKNFITNNNELNYIMWSPKFIKLMGDCTI